MQKSTQAFIAVPDKPEPKPAFVVRKMEGKVPHTVHIFDKKENRIKKRVLEEPAGYMVYFLKGHSIRVKDEEALKRIGLGLKMVPVIDPESGEVQGHVPNSVDLDAA